MVSRAGVVQPQSLGVSLAQKFDVFDIRWDFGWQRRLRVGFGEAVETEHRAKAQLAKS